MKYPWRFITVGFLAGLVAGALIPTLGYHRWDGKDPDKHRAHIMARMTSELQLDDSQRTQIDALVKASLQQRQTLCATAEQQAQVVMMNSRAQTRALLRPDQQVRFDKMIARLDARHKHNALPLHP